MHRNGALRRYQYKQRRAQKTQIHIRRYYITNRVQ